ncbi:hypothetical protein O3M35_006383 [Rhynocoris fuscipes]|uniref:Uncharacterized protein n=1 Tax=Rhynocoris fuscipes TaxID=488301 RepID=A0AAW1DDB4_9HEMI
MSLLKEAIKRGRLLENRPGNYVVSWSRNKYVKFSDLPTEGCKCYACEHARALQKEEAMKLAETDNIATT